MKISIITLFPKMISGFFEESIIKRAIDKKLVEIEIINLRDFAIDDYGAVDDRPYGGGAGMVIRVDVVHKALEKINPPAGGNKSRVVLTSPRGKLFNQDKAKEYSKIEHLIIIVGHYEGVDERVTSFIDEEVSIGDFVLTGGELPVCMIVDSVVRLISGVLKKDEAVKEESFDIKGKKLLEYPQYTRPEEYKGLKVPEVLKRGNHKEIEEWRLKKAQEITKEKRPDLLTNPR